MPYDDSTRAELEAEIGALMSELQADGVIFAELEVALVTVADTRTAQDLARGKPAAGVATTKILDPRPSVDQRDQWRTEGGERVRKGDGLLKIPRSACTLAELLAATHLTIGGHRYTLAEGGIKRTPFFWHVIVVRARA